MGQPKNLVGKQVPIERCEGWLQGVCWSLQTQIPQWSPPDIILAETHNFEEGRIYSPRVVAVLGQ